MNCNEILAIFLIYVFRFATKEFYKELVFFVVTYRLLMNERGWKICADNIDGYEVDTTEEFCESQNAEFIPDFCNAFIMDYFSNCI